MKLQKQTQCLAATGFTSIRKIAFRSGLGPDKAQERASRQWVDLQIKRSLI